MDNKLEKMHSIISSAPSEINTLTIYENITKKYDFKLIKSQNDAIKSKAPTLVSMQNKNKELADNLIKLMIAKTARAFNINRNIEPSQISELVETINTEYYYLKLSEVFYILKQAKMGFYGKTYERLDEPTILGWFNSYIEQRFNIFEEQSILEHQRNTSHEKQRQYDNYFENEYKKIAEKENKVMKEAKKLAEKMINKAKKSIENKILVDNKTEDLDNSTPRVAE